MATATKTRLSSLARNFRKDRTKILDDWTTSTEALLTEINGSVDTEMLRAQNGAIFDDFITLVETGDIKDTSSPSFVPILEGLAQIARDRSSAKLPARQLVRSLSSLKTALSKHEKRNGNGSVEPVLPVIDEMTSAALEIYLEEREEFIEAVVDTAADGFVTIDKTGIVQSFNRAAEEIFGFSAEEVIGQNIKMLMPSPYQEEHDGYLASYLQTGKAKIIGTRREVEGRRKDGSLFPMDLGIREIGKGSRRSFSGVVRDLTELKEAQREIERKTVDLMELSTPVISVWDDVIVLPLIGTLDSRRTQDCLEKALEHLTSEKARILIIDITGVPTVDTMVANHLIRLAASTRLMGGRCILTGISPTTAMTIVGLGVDLSMLATRSNLQEGLKLAIDLVENPRGSSEEAAA